MMLAIQKSSPFKNIFEFQKYKSYMGEIECVICIVVNKDDLYFHGKYFEILMAIEGNN